MPPKRKAEKPLSKEEIDDADTDLGTKARNWCFTLNNPTDALDFSEFPYCDYAIWQKEEGENGTPHFQGYLHLKESRNLKWLKAQCEGMLKKAHFAVCRGTPEQNIEYCSKEEGRLEGPYEFGTKPAGGQGTRNDLTEFIAQVVQGKTYDQFWAGIFAPSVQVLNFFHKHNMEGIGILYLSANNQGGVSYKLYQIIHNEDESVSVELCL